MDNIKQPIKSEVEKIETIALDQEEVAPRNRTFFMVAAILVVLAVMVAGYFIFATKDNDTTPPVSNADTTAVEDGSTVVDGGKSCVDGNKPYDDTDLKISFCYPEAWGNVSVEDTRFEPADQGSMYALLFSNKPEVQVGLISDDWATQVGRGGACYSPSKTLPDSGAYDETWVKTDDGTGNIIEARRGIATGSDQYYVEESVDDFFGGMCARGYARLQGSLYKYATASYFSGYKEGGVDTPAEHMADPLILFTAIERKAFIDFVRTIR